MRTLDNAIQQLGWDRVQAYVVSDGPLDTPAEQCFPANPVRVLDPAEWAAHTVEGTQGATSASRVQYSSPTAAALAPGHRNVQIMVERLHVRAFR